MYIELLCGGREELDGYPVSLWHVWLGRMGERWDGFLLVSPGDHIVVTILVFDVRYCLVNWVDLDGVF